MPTRPGRGSEKFLFTRSSGARATHSARPIATGPQPLTQALAEKSLMHDLMLNVLTPSHAPCRHFGGNCREMRWAPVEGHVPRGFCGATGDLSEVRLVLVTAEPGDPFLGESHLHNSLESAVAFSISHLRDLATPFHRNVRLIMDLCFPGNALDEQLRKVWRTNAVLCSARIECGSVPNLVERTCVSEYLTHQLALVPTAVVVALGGKAQRRLKQAGIHAFPALHPSCRESNTSKEASWAALAAHVQQSTINSFKTGGYAAP